MAALPEGHNTVEITQRARAKIQTEALPSNPVYRTFPATNSHGD